MHISLCLLEMGFCFMGNCDSQHFSIAGKFWKVLSPLPHHLQVEGLFRASSRTHLSIAGTPGRWSWPEANNCNKKQVSEFCRCKCVDSCLHMISDVQMFEVRGRSDMCIRKGVMLSENHKWPGFLCQTSMTHCVVSNGFKQVLL